MKNYLIQFLDGEMQSYGLNSIDQVTTLVIGTRVYQHFLSYNPIKLRKERQLRLPFLSYTHIFF